MNNRAQARSSAQTTGVTRALTLALFAAISVSPSIAIASALNKQAVPTSPPSTPSAAVERAHAAITKVLERRTTDPETTSKLLDQAEAELLGALALPELSDPSRSSILSDLAVVSLLQSDPASAILQLRRAELLCPLTNWSNYQRIVTNLNHARTLVRQTPRPSGDASTSAAPHSSSDPQQSASVLTSNAPKANVFTVDPSRQPIDWVYRVLPARWRPPAAIALIVSFSLIATIRVLRAIRAGWSISQQIPDRRHAALLPVASAGLILGLLLLISVPHQELRATKRCAGVVTTPNITPRIGPDDLTYPAAASPFPSGTEVRILGVSRASTFASAPTWVLVADGLDPTPRPVWIPASAVSVVDPACLPRTTQVTPAIEEPTSSTPQASPEQNKNLKSSTDQISDRPTLALDDTMC